MKNIFVGVYIYIYVFPTPPGLLNILLTGLFDTHNQICGRIGWGSYVDTTWIGSGSLTHTTIHEYLGVPTPPFFNRGRSPVFGSTDTPFFNRGRSPVFGSTDTPSFNRVLPRYLQGSITSHTFNRVRSPVSSYNTVTGSTN